MSALRPLCITCKPEDLDQGLFGNVFTRVFEVLPYLYERRIFPAWEIRSLHYGEPPSFLTLPGVMDLAYASPPGPYRHLSLNELRRRHGQVLGSDWRALARIWKAFFRIPERVLDAAESLAPKGSLLGLHYRGTDKQTITWDSNPISQDEYLSLVDDFLYTRMRDGQPAFDGIVAASDEHTFIAKLRQRISLPVTALGEVDFHLDPNPKVSRMEKSDRAMLDCVLLSRCGTVIETSSALPTFAKLFNPELEIYRTAASKRFNNMPYFPVAYVPALPVNQPASRALLERTMESDWTRDESVAQYRKPFAYVPRYPRNHRVFSFAAKLGSEEFAARLITGFA